ncbi:MAG: glycoside hydrolase family 29, partial [Massilia sp.]
PVQVTRLREIGAWLGKYGQSIYATRGGPFLPGDYGVSTHRDKTIYVHVLKWQGDSLLLPAIGARVVGARTLDGAEARFTQSERGIDVSVAPAARGEIDTIIALELDSPASAIKPLPLVSKRD